MDALRNYILTLFAVSVACAIVRCLTDEKSAGGKIIKMLCGIVLAITAISPLIQVRISNLDSFMDHLSVQSEDLVRQGENASTRDMASIISEKTEAYILEKASAFDCSLSVSVTLTEDSIPQPEAVNIAGTVSPYVRSRLAQIIEKDLGIPKEKQQWTYQN